MGCIFYTFTYYFWYFESHDHTVPSSYRYIINFGSYILVGIVICYIYVGIALIAKWHRNRIDINRQPCINTKSQNTVSLKLPKTKTSNMLIYLMVTYIVTWTPSLVVDTVLLLADLSYRESQIVGGLSTVSVLLGFSNSLWNMLIYIHKHEGMRQAYLNTICFNIKSK